MPLLCGALIGAGAMYILDPDRGKRRRALGRDKLVKASRIVTEKLPAQAGKRSRYAAGRLRGVRYEVGQAASRTLHPQEEDVDDGRLLQRVRSEVLRGDDILQSDLLIDAHDGTITLRGRLPTEDMARHVVERTRKVEGVRNVQDLIHRGESA